ncbi:hypothetical protein LTS18_010998, partial [Coniosporium uncinatum]
MKRRVEQMKSGGGGGGDRKVANPNSNSLRPHNAPDGRYNSPANRNGASHTNGYQDWGRQSGADGWNVDQKQDEDEEIACDACKVKPIKGKIWNCRTCEDHDICDKCNKKGRFYKGCRFEEYIPNGQGGGDGGGGGRGDNWVEEWVSTHPPIVPPLNTNRDVPQNQGGNQSKAPSVQSKTSRKSAAKPNGNNGGWKNSNQQNNGAWGQDSGGGGNWDNTNAADGWGTNPPNQGGNDTWKNNGGGGGGGGGGSGGAWDSGPQQQENGNWNSNNDTANAEKASDSWGTNLNQGNDKWNSGGNNDNGGGGDWGGNNDDGGDWGGDNQNNNKQAGDAWEVKSQGKKTGWGGSVKNEQNQGNGWGSQKQNNQSRGGGGWDNQHTNNKPTSNTGNRNTTTPTNAQKPPSLAPSKRSFHKPPNPNLALPTTATHIKPYWAKWNERNAEIPSQKESSSTKRQDLIYLRPE